VLRTGALAAVFVLLVAALPSYGSIPFWKSPVVDLANLIQFHKCAGRNSPYTTNGKECGDPTGRDMLYPPLMYWAFVWTRLVDFRVATYIWWAAILIILILVRRAYLAPADRARFWPEAFWLLLLAQFPVTFALERGNCDAWVLALWAGATVLGLGGRPLASGALAGTAVAAKLYPLFGVVVLVAGHAADRRALWRFLAGVAAAGALAVAIFPFETWTYVTVQLPEAAGKDPAAYSYSHALAALPFMAGWRALALAGALLVAWSLAAFRRLGSDPVPAFAGALAISTYFQRTSWDYNLITTYPLLLVLFMGVWRGDRAWGARWALLVVGLVAIGADRGFIKAHDLVAAKMLTEVGWLLATAGFYAVVELDRARAPGSP
jgi:hypothetical protein